MPTTVNNLEVFHSEVVFVPENGSVWIDHDNGTDSVKVNVLLVSDMRNPQQVMSRTTGRDDHAVIELSNWYGTDETAFARPSRLGSTVNGRELSIFVYGRKVGAYMRLEVQFYFGDLDG
ncbi:hypothetical protein [Vibrio coralliilyticus]|uniref:hypothetical protein n=1 Tax=Vibrio coralliilyticus TaxID=190893 RepID=UPI0015609748|nr:hypothetical protein [Vibrio coralliilyticus]NRF17532.1 hypothetical protein [Vibrio coralliilyticus]